METNQRRPRALAAILILCAVALGGLGGIVLDRLVLLPRVGYAGQLPAAEATDGVRATESTRNGRGAPHQGRRGSGDRYLRHIAEELELTEEQRNSIGAILNDQQERVMAITRETRPRMQEVAEDTRQAMREVLSEEQWARFQEMRHRSRAARGGDGRESGHPEQQRDTTAAPSGDGGS